MTDNCELKNEELNAVAGGFRLNGYMANAEFYDQAGYLLSNAQTNTLRDSKNEAHSDLCKIVSDFANSHAYEYGHTMYWYFCLENGFSSETAKKQFKFSDME